MFILRLWDVLSITIFFSFAEEVANPKYQCLCVVERSTKNEQFHLQHVLYMFGNVPLSLIQRQRMELSVVFAFALSHKLKY